MSCFTAAEGCVRPSVVEIDVVRLTRFKLSKIVGFLGGVATASDVDGQFDAAADVDDVTMTVSSVIMATAQSIALQC